MSDLTLFGYYRSSASYRIRIVLNLKALDWAYRTVRLNRGEQRSESFTGMNPSGLVPVLKAGDTTLSQSAAIAEWLEERYPEPSLLPGDADARARVREILAVIGCDVHPLQNLRVLNCLREDFGAEDAAVEGWIHRWIGAGFRTVETFIERYGTDRGFACGEAPTLADAWLVPQVYNARRYQLDLEPYPRIRAVDAHCRTLDAFARAAPERQPDAPGPPG